MHYFLFRGLFLLSVNGPLSSSLYLKRFHPLTLKSFVQPCCNEASAGRVWKLRGERLASSATTETTNSNGNNNQKRLQHSAITKHGNFTSLFVTITSVANYTDFSPKGTSLKNFYQAICWNIPVKGTRTSAGQSTFKRSLQRPLGPIRSASFSFWYKKPNTTCAFRNFVKKC